MERESKIAKAAAEYGALRIVRRSFEDDDLEMPVALMERAAALVTRLIEAPAESGDDLAHKAIVLLDWVEPCDLPNHLTVSLCRDTIRVHHQHDPTPRLFRISTEQKKPPAARGGNVP